MGWWRLGLLLAVGCDTAGSDTDPGATDASTGVPACASALSVQAGTGPEAFEPLVPDQVVTMVHGNQGGWHVDTAGLVSGSTGQVSVLPRVVLRDTGLQIAGEQQPQLLALVGYRDTECDGTFYGVRAFLDDTFDDQDTGVSPLEVICSFAGKEATVTIDVGDLTTGEVLSVSVDVTLQLDARDLDFCASL